jgi:predicted  nucleic acid-binding Zn-ribbon protein
MVLCPSHGFVVATLFIAQLAMVVSGSSVTPVAKVLKLLEDLKAEVEADGASEASSYDTFACFCKDTTKTKSESIIAGQDTIDMESSTIAQKTALKTTKLSELSEKQATHEEKTKELSDANVVFESDRATYVANDADLSKAITSLDNAVKALQAKASPQLLTLRSSVKKSIDLATALNISSAPKRKAMQTLLQRKVDPASPEYTFHSQGIIDTLTELLTDFRDRKTTADSEWGKTKSAHEGTISGLQQELLTNSEAVEKLKEDVFTLEGEIATSREALVNAQSALEEDQTYLKDLTKQCESRAKTWDQSAKTRSDEVTALTQAIDILTNRVSASDAEVNKRALLLSSKHSRSGKTIGHQAVSFIEVKTRNRISDVRRHEVAHRFDISAALRQKLDTVSRYLNDRALNLDSVVLSAAAARAKADPFAKVKQLMQKLIQRLLAEATAEATQKGFCDEQIGIATQDRDNRFAEARELSTEIGSLTVSKEKMEQDIDTLGTDISDLNTSLVTAETTRGEEKESNMNTLKTAREGLAAVKEAIGILKTFYKQAASSKQEKEAEKPAYRGKQESSSGIIGLLEVISSDFARTISQTTASEKQSAEGFVEFDRESKADTASKETKKELLQEDLASTKSSIEVKTSDLKAAMNLVDSALAALEGLKPQCMDVTSPYATRVAKREEEIEALTRALCLLDEGKVEDECKKA